MDRKRLCLILALLLMVQNVALAQDLLLGTFPIEPTSKVSLNKPEISFLKKYDIYILCTALFIYRLDAIERNPKNIVKEIIKDHTDEADFRLSDVYFDLENIDYFGKRGFTRYYPFYVHGQPYIIRIFRTDEKHHQPEVRVLYEGDIKSPPVSFQILEGVNAILEQCNLGPQEMPSPNKSEIYP